MSSHWVPVEAFPDYSVNPLGQVRREASKSKRMLDPRFNQYGVPYVGLMRDGQQCIRSLPRLVARAFVEQPSQIFDTPINLDGDRSNCRADNLMWRPRWYAVHYNHQFRERYPNPINAPVRALGDGQVFPDSLAAACFYGLLEREVVLAVLNGGFAWPGYKHFELARKA